MRILVIGLLLSSGIIHGSEMRNWMGDSSRPQRTEEQLKKEQLNLIFDEQNKKALEYEQQRVQDQREKNSNSSQINNSPLYSNPYQLQSAPQPLLGTIDQEFEPRDSIELTHKRKQETTFGVVVNVVSKAVTYLIDGDNI
ncbi:MAG: hypothetical protein Q8Q60_04940 [Candidatus Chromulinivorax sp.]|nr:hypothetical protein [Candidatus Chromulinivorax sp.]